MFASVAKGAGWQCEKVRNAPLGWEPFGSLEIHGYYMHAISEELTKSCKDS